MEYADPKLENLQQFLKDNNAEKKNIYVHCWRGGGRSKYLSKMIIDSGYKVKILEGGFKSYRKAVFEFFKQQEFPFELLELNGLTGVGKTELINSLKNEIPVIDLELSARHFSSLFGFVPYKIRNYKPVRNQSAFENDIYSQVIMNIKKFGRVKTFLIESESKKVGDFYIPENLYQKLLNAPSVNVIANKEVRIKRIMENYFGGNNEGIGEMLKIFNEKERHFRKELSNKIYDEIKSHLEKGDTYKFIEMMIYYYYDKKYKNKGKKPLAIVNNENLKSAENNILKIVGNFKN